MTTTQHSNQLLEELVAEEIGFQIDQIAEDLQREGWPIAMVKRFMFFFFKQKTAYEMQRSLVGSECV